MEYKVNKLPKSEIEILVIIPSREFGPHIKRAAVLISEESEIEGFRRGKAPHEVVKNKFGEMAILEKAAELAVQKTYPEVMNELVINNQLSSEHPPIGRPEIVVTKLAPGNELQYKAKIAVLPEVQLPDYKIIAVEIRKTKKEQNVSEEEVKKTIDWIRESRLARTPEGGRHPGPEGLGTTGEGEARKIPELADDFARSLGNFPTVEDLRKNIRAVLYEEKKEKERQRLQVETVEKVAEDAKIEVPRILVSSESEKMISELKSGMEGMGMKWEDYLAHIKKTAEDLKKEWISEAEKRVRVGLCLREIAKLEKIEPSEEEIGARASEFLRQFRSAGEMEKKVDVEELREYTKGILRNEKVLEFLEKI